MKQKLSLLLFLIPVILFAQKNGPDIAEKISIATDKIEAKCINWRRDFHQHPELGNSEFRTAKIIADHLRSLGIEVKENIGKTGVVGILKGAKPCLLYTSYSLCNKGNN